MADLDFNIHKSNSTYLADADMARADFNLKHFGDHLIGNRKDYLALGAVSCHFSKEIRPYEKYELETKLLCWDHKWFWLSTRFIGTKKPNDHRAQSLAQYVFKAGGGKTIPPEEVLTRCGFVLTEDVLQQNTANLKLAKSLLDLNDLKSLW